MKYKISRNSLAVVVSSVILFVSSCASDPRIGNVRDGNTMTTIKAHEEAKKYNLALVDAIKNADKVVIKEHSHRADFFGTVVGSDDIPQYIYRQKELSPGEKILFSKNVRNLEAKAKTLNKNCLFLAHHTIYFYEDGVLKSSMEVCYECSDVKWNGSKHRASKDLFEALTPTIIGVGMKTHRAWGDMAKFRYEEEKLPTPPNVNTKSGIVPTAKWAEGQKGKKVINPYTGKLVDVEGIPANTKVRDPQATDPKHIFRVPEI